MKFWRFITIFSLIFLLIGSHAGIAHADPAPIIEKGLLITPLRQFLSGDAGATVKSSLIIANLTDAPLTVKLSVQQFSVTDYVYDYTFTQPTENWVQISTDSVTLPSHQSKDIPYTIQIPPKSAPGGHYYTLFATANLKTQGISSTIQAADLLYLTVNGKLTSVSHLQNSSIKWVSFGHDIPFTLEPINTGNVYSFIYISGQLHGLITPPPIASGAHLLIPGKVRRLNDKIPAPVLPGIYLAKYGYKTENGWVIQKSHLVLVIPPWFIAFLLAALLIGGRFLPRRKKPAKHDKITTEDD